MRDHLVIRKMILPMEIDGIKTQLNFNKIMKIKTTCHGLSFSLKQDHFIQRFLLNLQK